MLDDARDTMATSCETVSDTGKPSLSRVCQGQRGGERSKANRPMHVAAPQRSRALSDAHLDAQTCILLSAVHVLRARNVRCLKRMHVFASERASPLAFYTFAL